MNLLQELKALLKELQSEKMQRFKRRVSVGDLLTDRWEIARQYGFGEGTSCYDNVLILGDVRVGKHTWIGPNVILDGSGGGLEIGDYCTIGAGTHIYTHDTMNWALSGGKLPAEIGPVRVGSCVFIGPKVTIARGVTVGDRVAIGAHAFVNTDIPAGMMAAGIPAMVRGKAPSQGPTHDP